MSDKRKKTFFIIAALAAFSCLLLAFHPEKTYRFPMNGNSFLISGTFGELRTNHFHSGLDVKTGGKTGEPLYAIDDGYIYRLKVSPYGFGKAVYIRHHDGRFSVYAHIDGFAPDLEAVVYQNQYSSKQYSQEIYPEKDEIPVKKGQLIAYSGNSGSSMGPHLHFEIREPDERITNPQIHYPGMISDHIPPIIQHIAFEPLEPASRIEGRYQKLVLNPSGSNGKYEVPGTIRISGKAGLEYRGYDLLNGAGNHCGINYARLYLDDQLIWEYRMEAYAFDEKRYINIHFDYPWYKRHGVKFEKAYVDEGNKLPCYVNVVDGGGFELADDQPHRLRLELEDSYRNKTELTAKVIRSASGDAGDEIPASFKAEVIRNTLRVSGADQGMEFLLTDGSKLKVKPYIKASGRGEYVLPLSGRQLPAEVQDLATGKKIYFSFREMIYPDKNNVVEYDSVQLYFPYQSVFDTMAIEISPSPAPSGAYSRVYEVGDPDFPLFIPFIIQIRPDRQVKKDHLVIAQKNRYGNWEYLGNGRNTGNGILAYTSTFGEFCLMSDSIAPDVRPVNFTHGKTISSAQRTLTIKATDNFSGIDDDRAYFALDGEWILFEYDFKTNTFTHHVKERPASGSHELEVMIWDQNNNLYTNRYKLYF